MWSDSYPDIKFFLKNNLSFFKENGSEYIIHCPYCGDEFRKNAHHHGHLYISSKHPVFHCFRCEMSGALYILLKDLGYDNIDILNNLNKKLVYTQNTNIIKTFNKKNNINFFNINYKFKNGDPANFNIYEQYLKKRLKTFFNYSKYGIIPEVINNRICVSFYNYHNNFTTARIIQSTNNYRYIKSKDNSILYYFQEFDFDTYKNIVICEGLFDIIKLHLYSVFPKNTFYLAMLGKKYGKTIEYIIKNHLLFGKYNINLIFDADNKYFNNILNISKHIIQRLNNNITLYGYLPTISKDVGEFPLVVKI